MRLSLLLAALLVLASVLVLPPPAAAAAPGAFTVTTGSLVGSVTDLNTVDGAVVTLTEAVTGLLDQTAWLKPNGDDGPNEWLKTGAPTCTTETECIDDDPVHDGNTTIIVGLDAAPKTSEFAVQDWGARPTDITIDSVTTWTIARKNQTTGSNTYAIVLQEADVNCDGGVVLDLILTQAFANQSYSSDPVAPCAPSGAWAVADVNNFEIRHITGGVGTDPDFTVTASGITVQYDDADYTVLATATWSSVLVAGPVTLEVGGRISDTGDNFDVQVQECGSGTWTTLDDSQFTASTSQRSYQVTGRVCSGTVTVRLVDDDPSGEDQAALALDQLSLTFGTGGGGDGIDFRAFFLECTPGFAIRCVLGFTGSPPLNVTIVRTAWWSGGVWQGPGAGSGIYHEKEVAAPFPAGRTNVTVEFTLSNGQTFIGSRTIDVDNTWIVLVFLVLVVAIVVLVVLRFARRTSRAAQGEHRREEEDAERRRKRDLYRGLMK